MKKRLEIIPYRCTGCKTCELACAFFHSEDRTKPGQPRISVVQCSETLFVPFTCFQCVEPACVKACLIQALTRNPETGAIELDEKRCIRCQACFNACPFGNIHLEAITKTVHKCDLCSGDPMCAKFCPSQAIVYTDITQET
ncbi:4Fe-4S dicluster domain-containing protein [bacterium]|nr:4Fe-4S dicluster domain-containing protein [bacterium]